MSTLPDSLEQLLSDAVKRHGLAEKYDEIRPHARLTFLMKVTPLEESADVPTGVSRFGGTPDLPPSENWARNPTDGKLLSFIGQLSLSQIPKRGQPLPNSGLLQIYSQDENAGDNEHSIRYFADTEFVRTETPDDDEFSDEYCDGPTDVLLITEFVPSVSLPDSFDTFEYDDDEFHNAYHSLAMELHNIPTQKEPTSRLLGNPFDYELDEGEELLIEVQSHFHNGHCYMNFWDAGCLQILVKSSELPLCQFSDSKAMVASN